MADDALNKRARYHHGNLPGALVSAAYDLIGESGIDGLTLRAVAQRVGVTHAAPYRHFKDKAALLAAVAARSHDELDKTLREENDVEGIARAYVHYATAHPASYEVILRTRDRPPLASIIRDIVPDLDADRAHAIWALCHGIASLINGGQLVVDSPESLAFTSVRSLVAS